MQGKKHMQVPGCGGIKGKSGKLGTKTLIEIKLTKWEIEKKKKEKN